MLYPMTINGVRYIRLADVLEAARRLSAFTRENAILDENKKFVDEREEATYRAYDKLFHEIAGPEVEGETKEEAKKLMMELHSEYYVGRYAIQMKDDGKSYYFRKLCAGAVAARMTEEGKSAEEIAKAIDDGETLPVFSSDPKLARLFDDYDLAVYMKNRCEDEGLTVEIVPAVYTAPGALQKFELDRILETADKE